MYWPALVILHGFPISLSVNIGGGSRKSWRRNQSVQQKTVLTVEDKLLPIKFIYILIRMSNRLRE